MVKMTFMEKSNKNYSYTGQIELGLLSLFILELVEILIKLAAS